MMLVSVGKFVKSPTFQLINTCNVVKSEKYQYF